MVVSDLALRVRGPRHQSFISTWPDRASALDVPVRWQGDTAFVNLGPVEAMAVVEAGRIDVIDVPTQRIHSVRWTGDSLPPLPGLKRPPADYSAPSDADYTAEDLRVPVRAGTDTFSLACTLTEPKGGHPPYPAALTITGSGSQSRDEDLWPLVPGYRPFRQIAEHLATAGIAVLRCDDRGVGGSGGDARLATTLDLAGDVRQVVEWMRHHRGIDGRRIALIGHSEGGLIAPMVAAQDRRLAAIVLMAGPAKPGVDILVDQVRWPVMTAPGLSPERRAAMADSAERAVRVDTANAVPWIRWFRTHDPLTDAHRVTQPVLILQGALDRQVSAGQADTLAAALRASGNRNVTEKVYPHLNHLFLVSPTDGSPAEYVALKDVAIPEQVLADLTGWLKQQLR